MGFGDLFTSFTQWCSVHGLSVSGNIVPQHKLLRALFVCLFIGGFIGFIIQVSLLVDQFNRREVETSVIMQFQPLIFPAVTFCNINPYKKSALFNSRPLTELMSGYNFVTQLQSLAIEEVPNFNKKRKKRQIERVALREPIFRKRRASPMPRSAIRRKREVMSTCSTRSSLSPYANVWSNNHSVEHYLRTCSNQIQNIPQFCMAGCGDENLFLCTALVNSTCDNTELENVADDIDRVFRECLEQNLCQSENFCDEYATIAECVTSLGNKGCVASPADACVSAVEVVCSMAMQYCSTEQKPCITPPTVPPTQAPFNPYLIPSPPPPPGVLPPIPAPNPLGRPHSLDPWVPPPPPSSLFYNYTNSSLPPPPLEFSVLGLMYSNSSDARALLAQLSNIADELDLDPSLSTGQTFIDVQMQMIEVAAELSSDMRESLGYSANEMFVSCAFDGVPCDVEKDFQLFADSDYGNCYTYNNDSSKRAERPGSGYGLRVTVIANVSEYLFTTQQSGARVVVHSPGTVPFPSVQGYSVSSGSATNFKVRYNEFERMKEPYGNCTETYDINEDYYYVGQYTYEGCFRSCFQDYVLDKCKCGDSRFPIPIPKKKTSPTYSLCRRTNTTETACLDDILDNKMDKATENCPCSLPCYQQGYSVSPGLSDWPANPKFQSRLCKPSLLKLTGLTCQEFFKRNALTVEVFYDYFNYEVVVEIPVMDKQGLWTQASSAGGFWFSLGFMSTFEIIITLFQLFLFIFGCGKLPDLPTAY